MDFALTDDQAALRELALKIIGDYATHERLKEIEAAPEWFDAELWAELAKASLLGIAIPAEDGGSGLGFCELCLLLEAVGRHCVPVPAWPTLGMGALAIARFGTTEQRREFLPAVAHGDAILTAALVDTQSEDPLEPTVTATRDGADWKLEGVKMCVPVAHLAKRVVAPVRTGENEVGVFLVDPKATGVALERQETTQGEPQFRMQMTGLRVPASAMLIEPANGKEALGWLVDRALAGLCAMQVGVVERALRMTAEYTSTREQFGKPIAKFQAVAQRAADAFIDVETIRWSAWQAVWRLARDLPAKDAVDVAKFCVSEAGHRVVYAAQHLHGGIGVDIDYPLYRSYCWAKQIELTLGCGTQHLLALGNRMAEGDEAATQA